MVFSSLTFICVFLPLVFLAATLLPSLKLKNALLILASLFFYAYGEPVYVLLMIVSSLMNYVLARIIASRMGSGCGADGRLGAGERRGDSGKQHGGPAEQHGSAGERRGAKPILALAVVANLAFLVVFKYAGMLAGTADSLFGLSLNIPLIALPIGISFYTFQAMSYVIDVYRGKAKASRSYPKVLLYISFFPQLIAGPIIKYSDVDEQLENRKVTADGVAKGLRRFSVGLAKKVLIANTMAVVADTVFATGDANINAAVVWIGAFAYLMQIYFDFSGYSDMAIGLARIFGFRYKENFNYPYTSASITEFWRRWHISLSTWFKEYLYIPLGGNRKGRLRASLNKVVVFFLCGLWHGASWTFVVWGLFHGLFLLLEQYLPIRRLPKALGFVYAIVVVMVGFVLFRADSIDQAGFFITQMFTGWHFDTLATNFALQQLTPLFIIVSLVAIVACLPVRQWILAAISKRGYDGENVRSGRGDVSTSADADVSASGDESAAADASEGAHTGIGDNASAGDSKLASVMKALSFVAAIVLLLLCILTLSSSGYNPFIYFRF